MAYHSIRGIDWENAACLGWCPYSDSNGALLYITAREITMYKRKVSYVQVEKSVGVLSVVYDPAQLKALAKTADAVSSMIDASVVFSNRASDVLIVDDKMSRRTRHGI